MIYARDRVEKLVPGIWDEARVLEMPDELRPAPDMPKAPQVDPRRSTDKVTELADIQQAWTHAPLTTRQRQAILLVRGLDMTGAEAASYLGVSRQVVGLHCFKGISALMHWLNGTSEGEDDVQDDNY